MKTKIDRDLVVKLYLEEKLSCAKIAERLGFHSETIRKKLILWGIKRRSAIEQGRPGQKRKLELTPDELDYLYWHEMKTAAQIGEMYSIHSATVRLYLRRYGIPRRPPGGQQGFLNAAWQGGVVIDKNGYVLVHAPQHPNARDNGKVLEHRLVMESVLGRYLEPNEVVHHKDGNKRNNDPSNLEVYKSNAAHLKEELTGRIPNWSPEGKARLESLYKRFREKSGQAS